MEVYTIKDLSFAYPNTSAPVLHDISLNIHAGEFITLCGASGCGKTTLLRHLKSSLTPCGEKTGEILFGGKQLETVEKRIQAARIGFVMQSPENQIVTDKVWHELAFGLENLGVNSDIIRIRVAEMANFFGIQSWFHKEVSELSGGQKQLLNLASVMVMQPEILILDEPTAQLDLIAAEEFLRTIYKINRELGVTVILSEHRLEETIPLSDRILVMKDGKVLLHCTPYEIGENLDRIKRANVLRSFPAAVQIYSAVPNECACPISVRDGKAWFDTVYSGGAIIDVPVLDTTDLVLEVKDGWFRYEKNGPDILKKFRFTLRRGECYALLGGNGAGKTTALSVIGGLQRLYRGDVWIDGKKRVSELSAAVGILPQNPQTLFVKKTVMEDLMEIFEDTKSAKEENQKRVCAAAELCDLTDLLYRHPYDLSGGEQQRAALAKVLLTQPNILLLDEPTKGMDGEFKARFGTILKKLQREGVSILIVSHDIDFCAEFADRCGIFFDGSIVSEGETHYFFSGNSFYTTAANRMVRHALPEAVTVQEVISACGGSAEQISLWETERILEKEDKENWRGDISIKTVKKAKTHHFFTVKTLIGIIAALLTVPATIGLGIIYLNDRKYYFISLLVLLEIMAPFFLAFEGRKPRARELVILAVLCGAAIVGRTAFAAVPQIKPAVAIIIITGVCFGGESGFLVGALTGFISNFFFGQGPWTPWQMFALGIIGLVAGVLERTGLLSKQRVPLSIFGGLITLILYGGIMNLNVLLTSTSGVTWEQALLVYGAGFWFDLLHAVSTAIFLFLLAPSMLEKLERIKMKYGMM